MTTSAACQNILTGIEANSNVTMFDNDNGRMYIIDASACWTAIKAEFQSSLDNFQTQIDQLAALNQDTTALQAAFDSFSSMMSYTSGVLVFTQWQWDESALADGEQIGLCYQQPTTDGTENYASCWAFTYSSSTQSYDAGQSFMIQPSTLTSSSNLSDFTALSNQYAIGTVGQWILVPPTTAFGTTKTAYAVRFSPAAGSTRDPGVYVGPVDVATYRSSRSGALFASEKMRLMQSSSGFNNSGKFAAESKTLGCYDDASCATVSGGVMTGALAGVAASMIAIATMLSF